MSKGNKGVLILNVTWGEYYALKRVYAEGDLATIRTCARLFGKTTTRKMLWASRVEVRGHRPEGRLGLSPYIPRLDVAKREGGPGDLETRLAFRE